VTLKGINNNNYDSTNNNNMSKYQISTIYSCMIPLSHHSSTITLVMMICTGYGINIWQSIT